MRKLFLPIHCSICSVAALCLFAIGVATAQEPASSNASVATSSPAKTQTAEPDPTANPKYVAAMAEGKKLEHERQYVFAIDAYKKANKIAGGRDRSSLRKAFDLQMKTGGYKDAIATAATLESIASNATEKSFAESDRGRAILAETGDKNKVDKLQAADAAFKSAVADAPKNATALYMDGIVLARLNQMDAAREQFKACASCIGPKDPSFVRAKHFAENPALSTAKMAPAFTVVALDGTKFNLDEMGGRVVLIDFWATWCGPCNEELPHLKKIAKEFAGEPLVMISVSDDKDETKWKDFIAKHEMTWVQYRDANGELGKQFGVQSIPHYFTIDADGVLTAEMMGSGSDVEGRLKKLIAKAKAAGAKPVTVASGAQ